MTTALPLHARGLGLVTRKWKLLAAFAHARGHANSVVFRQGNRPRQPPVVPSDRVLFRADGSFWLPSSLPKDLLEVIPLGPSWTISLAGGWTPGASSACSGCSPDGTPLRPGPDHKLQLLSYSRREDHAGQSLGEESNVPYVCKGDDTGSPCRHWSWTNQRPPARQDSFGDRVPAGIRDSGYGHR